jgi:Aldo/keto reductase family
MQELWCWWQNMELVERMKHMAKAKGCTPAQLSLAWLLHKGDDIFPIPGSLPCHKWPRFPPTHPPLPIYGLQPGAIPLSANMGFLWTPKSGWVLC